jgi:hypothetical protein
LQCGFHRRNGQGVARQCPADAAHIGIVHGEFGGEGLAHFFGETIDRGGDASSEGFAEGEKIRLKSE